ncbi:IS200/IS605 family transposase [Labilibaculum sp. A4]|uniref:IS200/IS605 family transposase n=1 Tax=Labilibaculum euxinus TaxID=2686357 RepID=UPI000F61EDA1|nr:IS200/IS605 family transposase [Labilibaculum euxinus]MDQ1770547.1 IS200/IS605 family transposase [Labilibaculum euxinus]MWN75234.1 IS200/IS605 family transposase [Labilibaculum euxinus]
MSTYTQILYQIVFSTKYRDKTLRESDRERLFHFIGGILVNKNCHLYRIGGVEDHIHIVTHLHPAIALSNLVKDIKLGTCDFIKSNHILPDFSGWQEGYGAFTYDVSAKDNLIAYVKNQKEHHSKLSYREEYIQLLEEHDVEFEEKYLF